MKAPNGKPTKLNESQWVQVRTPAFKEWFGDWEKYNQSKNLKGDPVAKLTGDEFEKSSTPLTELVDSFFKSEYGGSVNNSVIGDIELDRRGVKDSIAHGLGRKKAAAFKAVADVIKHGDIIDVQKNWKNRGYTSYVIAAPIEMAGKIYIETAIITQSKTSNRFYLHEVGLRDAFKTDSKAASSATDSGASLRPINNIVQDILSVNREDVSKVVDENGEPLVVYHGTERGGFSSFDDDESGRASGNVTNGFYFADSRRNSETYSGDDSEAEVQDGVGEIRTDEYGDEYEVELEHKSGIYSTFLNIKDAIEYDFEGRDWGGVDEDGEGFGEYITVPEVEDIAYSSDADGAIIKNVIDECRYGAGYGWGNETYIVFNPSDIKSATSNTGQFNKNNSDIRYSKKQIQSQAKEVVQSISKEGALMGFAYCSSFIFLGGKPPLTYCENASK